MKNQLLCSLIGNSVKTSILSLIRVIFTKLANSTIFMVWYTLYLFYSLKSVDLYFKLLFFMCQVRVFGFSGLLGDIQVLKHN